jgi:hypothetical protein
MLQSSFLRRNKKWWALPTLLGSTSIAFRMPTGTGQATCRRCLAANCPIRGGSSWVNTSDNGSTSARSSARLCTKRQALSIATAQRDPCARAVTVVCNPHTPAEMQALVVMVFTRATRPLPPHFRLQSLWETIVDHLFCGTAPFSGTGLKLAPIGEGASGPHEEQLDTAWLGAML